MKRKLGLGVLLVGFVFGFNLVHANALAIDENCGINTDNPEEEVSFSKRENGYCVVEKNITEQITVTGGNVTIDLNGHSIIVDDSTYADAIVARNGVVLTIVGEGLIQSKQDTGLTAYSGSTIILKSGDVRAQEFGAYTGGGSTFTMDGGTITTVDNCGVGGNGSNKDSAMDYTININGGTITSNIKSAGYVSCGIYHPNRGTVNITGGVINSTNGAGVVQRAGILNITGGTINAQGSSIGTVGDSRVVVSASALVLDKEANYPQVATMQTRVSSNAILNGAAGAIEKLGENVDIELIGGIYSDEPDGEEIPEGYNAYKILEGENTDKYVVVKEDELVLEVLSGLVPEEEIPAEELQLIKDAIKNKFSLATYYAADLAILTPNGDIVGYDAEPGEAVEVEFGLPMNLPKVKSGYTRKYYVIRVHNGKVTIIDNVKVKDDGTISFKSDKFSTYALAYEDVKNEEEKAVTSDTSNPKTGDSIILYIVLVVASFVGTALTTKYLKKYN